MWAGARQVPTGPEWRAGRPVHTESYWHQRHCNVCCPCRTDAQVCSGLCLQFTFTANWVYLKSIKKVTSVYILHVSMSTIGWDNRALLFLDNNGLSWTVSAPDKVTAVPVRWNGNFQTPISVPAVRPKRCHTLSNPAHRQDYTVACLNYTLQTMMPLPGWPVMAPNAYDNNNIGCVQCS